MFWSPGSGGAGSHEHALDDLTDVTVDYPAVDEALLFDGSGWVNAPVPTGGTHGLDDHSDVDLSGVADGDALVWDADYGLWVPGVVTGSADLAEGVGTVEVADAAPLSLYINAPQAIYNAGTGRTYLAFLGAGRDLYVTWHNHLTGDTATPVLVGTYPLSDDNDHGAPSIAVGADGRVHVVWGAHNSSHRHSRTDDPHDISAWTTQTMPSEGTYPNLVALPGGDLLVFDRAGGLSHHGGTGHGATFPAHEFGGVYRSTDGGASWSAPTAIIDTTGSPEAASDVYLHSALLHDGLVYLTWIVARGAAHDGPRIDLHVATYDPASGDMATVDGTSLGSVITWAEHSQVVAYAATPLRSARTLVRAPDDIRIATATGTDGTGESGTYTVRVVTWDGTAWSTVDTEIPQAWRFADAVVADHAGQLVLLASERVGARSDVVVYMSGDGSAWYRAGVVVVGVEGEGMERVQHAYGSPWLAVAQAMPDGWARTSATAGDLLPIVAVTPGTAPDETHTHDQFALVDHTHPDAELHRLVVLLDDGYGAKEPLTDADGFWLYGAFPGPEH